MRYFDTYTSNSIAGSSNQYIFRSEAEKIHRGRIYYKIFAGGTYHYSLLFSNIIDSTFADGSASHCNLLCDEWEILEASLGVCKTASMAVCEEPERVAAITFGGNSGKTVMPGEFFTTDPVEISAEKGDFLCMDITFRGTVMPYHEETMLPTFVMKDGEWVSCKHIPFASMIGCDRKVEKRVGFFGDSITQGLGTPNNKYTHWNALAAESIGEKYSYWNLGIGYGRGADAPSDGAWLFKAKQMDAVVVCFGTNDVGFDHEVEKIKKDLRNIVFKLKEVGVKVLLQSLPPFDRKGEKLEKWLEVNRFVREELAAEADAFFDVVPILIDGPEVEGKSKFNGHPNEKGCALWAEALLPVLKEFLGRA